MHRLFSTYIIMTVHLFSSATLKDSCLDLAAICSAFNIPFSLFIVSSVFFISLRCLFVSELRVLVQLDKEAVDTLVSVENSRAEVYAPSNGGNSS